MDHLDLVCFYGAGPPGERVPPCATGPQESPGQAGVVGPPGPSGEIGAIGESDIPGNSGRPGEAS